MISSGLVESFRFAAQALRANGMRTALTALSVLIANAAVILVVSFALAGRDFVVAQIGGEQAEPYHSARTGVALPSSVALEWLTGLGRHRRSPSYVLRRVSWHIPITRIVVRRI